MIHLYEIDGVLCNNRQIHDLTPLESLVYQRGIRALHRPQHSFSILTGRPQEYTGDTLFWLIRNSLNFDTLFHGNTDPDNPDIYKLDTLNYLKSQGNEVAYYDSDLDTVEFLQTNGINAQCVDWRGLELQRLERIKRAEQDKLFNMFRSKQWG